MELSRTSPTLASVNGVEPETFFKTRRTIYLGFLQQGKEMHVVIKKRLASLVSQLK
jgi:hypothetical protein